MHSTPSQQEIRIDRISSTKDAVSELQSPDPEKVRTSVYRRQSLQSFSRILTENRIKVQIEPDLGTAYINQEKEPSLMAITGRAIDQPVTDFDQETWDYAAQYAFAIHECGHALFTDHEAFIRRLEDLDKHIQPVAKQFWNIVEDGFIELALRETFSDHVEQLLRALRANIHTDNDAYSSLDAVDEDGELSEEDIPDDLTDEIGEMLPETAQVFDFFQAIMSATMEMAVWPTGNLNSLLNADNDAYVFASDEDREHFYHWLPKLSEFIREALDEADPIDRANLIFDFWEELEAYMIDNGILPDPDEIPDNPAGGMPNDADADLGEGQVVDEVDDMDEGEAIQQVQKLTDSDADDEESDDADSGSDSQAQTQSPAAEPDQEDESQEANSTGDGDGDSEESDDTSSDSETSGAEQDDPSAAEDGAEDDEADNSDDTDGDDESGLDDGQASLNQYDDEEAEEADDSDEDAKSNTGGGDESEEEESNSDETGSGEDGEDSESESDDDGENGVGEGADDGEDESGDTEDSESSGQNGQNEDSEDTDEEAGKPQAGDGDNPLPDEEPSTDELLPDEDELREEINQRMERERDAADENAQTVKEEIEEMEAVLNKDSGGKSISDIRMLIQDGEQNPELERKARRTGQPLANTFKQQLIQEQRASTIRNKRRGKLDRKSLSKLVTKNSTRIFKRRHEGDEKDYAVVVVLDRSGSMGGEIETAEEAVGAFMYSLDEVPGVDSCLIDLYQSNARVVKPFGQNVNTCYDSIYSGRVGGGTPLTEMLYLARERVQQSYKHPFVIVITDGCPRDNQAYTQELLQTKFPVYGVLLNLGGQPGQEKDWVNEQKQNYDAVESVYDGADLQQSLLRLTQKVFI